MKIQQIWIDIKYYQIHHRPCCSKLALCCQWLLGGVACQTSWNQPANHIFTNDQFQSTLPATWIQPNLTGLIFYSLPSPSPTLFKTGTSADLSVSGEIWNKDPSDFLEGYLVLNQSYLDISFLSLVSSQSTVVGLNYLRNWRLDVWFQELGRGRRGTCGKHSSFGAPKEGIFKLELALSEMVAFIHMSHLYPIFSPRTSH